MGFNEKTSLHCFFFFYFFEGKKNTSWLIMSAARSSWPIEVKGFFFFFFWVKNSVHWCKFEWICFYFFVSLTPKNVVFCMGRYKIFAAEKNSLFRINIKGQQNFIDRKSNDSHKMFHEAEKLNLLRNLKICKTEYVNQFCTKQKQKCYFS